MLLVIAVGKGQLEQVRMGEQRTNLDLEEDLRQQLVLTAGIAGGQDLGLGTTINQNYD